MSAQEHNESSLCGDQLDQPFAAPTFDRSTSRRRSVDASQGRGHDDKEMPSNLMNSRSNVPGMTPAELMTAHRRSIAALPGNENKDLDLHSITLSRHQVEPQDAYHADLDDVPDEEYQECLNSFKFGEQTAAGGDDADGIHTNA